MRTWYQLQEEANLNVSRITMRLRNQATLGIAVYDKMTPIRLFIVCNNHENPTDKVE